MRSANSVYCWIIDNCPDCNIYLQTNASKEYSYEVQDMFTLYDLTFKRVLAFIFSENSYFTFIHIIQCNSSFSHFSFPHLII